MCTNPEVLLAEAAGVLPEDVAARVRAHVAECPACREARDVALASEVRPLTEDEDRRIRARIAEGLRSESAR